MNTVFLYVITADLPNPGSTSHALQLGSELWVLLLDFQLCPCRFGVAEGVNNLSFCSGQVSGFLKVFQSFRYSPLLKEELSNRSHSNIAVRVNYE